MTKENTFVAIKASALPATVKETEALAAKATTQGNNSQRNFQIAACAHILHLAKHEDIRVIRRFLANMPEGMRVDSMTKFFDQYAQVRFETTEDANGKETTTMHFDKDGKTLLGVALEKPWWKAITKSEYKPFNFVLELEKLLARTETRYNKVDAAKGDDVTPEDINSLKALIKAQKTSELRLVQAVQPEAQAA